jgi:hypothetical protein
VPNILISYRREDSDAIAGRIRDRIVGRFGVDSVFMDIDSIPFGLDFRKQVQHALTQNDIVLAIIGPKWLGVTRGGSARIRDELDPVRIEIETALKRGIPVIPVLVGRAAMPKANDLPDSLKDLSFLNAAEVSAGRDFGQQMERLLRSIDRFLEGKAGEAVSRSTDIAPNEVNIAASPRTHDGIRAPESKHGRKHTGISLWMEKSRLLFGDQDLERAFMDSFRNRFYVIGQTSMLFGITGWIVFGATDLLSGVGGLQSTRFRFMLAMPLMFLFFGLSFTKVARRLWQSFFAAFAVVGIACMYTALILVGREAWFRVEQGTMSFMFFLALVGLAPFTTVYTIAVGLFITLLHAYYILSYPDLAGVHALFYNLFAVACYLIACTAAWVRESSLRLAFLDKARSLGGSA